MFHLVVTCFLAGATQVFSYAQIRWGGFSAKSFILAPKVWPKDTFVPHRASVRHTPAELIIWHRVAGISRSRIPCFTVNPDQTISLDGTGLCIEARGVSDGDMVGINDCTGGSTQLWMVSPQGWGDSRLSRIQLKGSDKCIAVAKTDANNGDPVQLQDCDGTMAKSWAFQESLPSQTRGTPQLPTFSLSVRFVVVLLMLAVVLGLLNLRSWSWRQQPIRRAVATHKGGVCLIDPSALHMSTIPRSSRGRQAPVIMSAVSAEEKPECRTPQCWKPWNASDLSDPASTILLNDGNRMPALGLGAAMPPQLSRASVRTALELGYRYVDTASNYLNEVEVGAGVRDFMHGSGVPREEIFISTKLDTNARTYQAALEAGKKSCAALGLEYVDLMLIHTPFVGKLVELYDALLELQSMGVVRSIGVSNFDEPHLSALEYYERPAPAVNQIEMHPLIYAERSELVTRCQTAGIQIIAFCPLLNGVADFFNYGTLPDMAAQKGRTPAQILLRWGLQRGFAVIPKSVRQDRQSENSAVFDFELQSEELLAVEAMQGFRGAKKYKAYPAALDAIVDVGKISARLFSGQT